MTDISYTDWYSMSDNAVAGHIGAFISHHRLEENKTQEELARSAGISRSTLSLLERGETVTLATLIQVLRALNKLQIMDVFSVNETISPLELAKKEKAKKRRAGGKKEETTGMQ
jgi:transcriptional regulator with XRE-family HTH domain